MKKYWLIGILIVTSATVASAIILMKQQKPHAEEWLAQALNLTPEQRSRLWALGREFNGRCDALCAAMCESRVALSGALQKADRITPEIEQLLEKLQAAQAASERETVAHLFRIKSILSPQQQEQYIELIAGKLCGHCSAGGHAAHR